MKLSIVITTKNRQQDLLNCLHSILLSVFSSKFEIIIIDDCSKDGTEKLDDVILQTMFNFKNIRIYHYEESLKLVKARNVGAKLAKGKYVLFIDDDNVVENKMIQSLVDFANEDGEYKIIGPTMYRSDAKKYLSYQKFNFFTGKTTGVVVCSLNKINNSDGVPNVFLIKQEVFKKCGYFDEDLIQTYTEPDFTFRAKRYGYKSGIMNGVKVYHNVEEKNPHSPRALGGMFSQKAYCLIRNRFVIIGRYGKWYHKFIFLLFFSWIWPCMYSFFMLRFCRFELIKLYWFGFRDGIIFFLTKKLRNSLS